MKAKRNLCGFSRAEMEQAMVALDLKAFRGRQVYKWIYKNRVFDFERMTDLKKDVRQILSQHFYIGLPKAAARQKSRDGTEKFLFELEDKETIETVLIPDDNSGRMTLCISSQVGCPLGCRFCATGYLGFKRNLTVGEIVGQVLAVREMYGDEAFDNIVFMGMGEPLLNYENVMATIAVMTDSVGLMVGAKRITISTVGIAPAIKKLARTGSKVNLALSLNAPNDRLRREIMPITKTYPLKQVMEAIREWVGVRKRRVTFEYILFKDFNDRREHALELAELVKGIPCKINLLSYNPVEGAAYRRPEEAEIDAFAQILYPRTPAVTVRKSRGKDIDAACGQLAGKKGYS
jgi:23S rRNA (adenine2503-C2)-methyltransferase